jgi:hypothetical protein
LKTSLLKYSCRSRHWNDNRGDAQPFFVDYKKSKPERAEEGTGLGLVLQGFCPKLGVNFR